MTKKYKENSPEQRRKALFQTIVGASVIGNFPATWIKPVAQTILLPTHASTTDDTPPPLPPPPPPLIPLAAKLDGVVEGVIGTEFSVDASASTGPEGTNLSYSFTAQGACSLVSQSGATAIIRRNLIAGDCEVSLSVSDGSNTDAISATAVVTGGPPLPP